MKGSITIANLGGTRIKLHLTFLILLAWIGIDLWIRSGPEAAANGLLFITGLFTCVLLHEMGHAAAARFYGIRTPMITLLPFGGLASIERIPKKPLQEIVIAVAGPMVNVIIIGILWLTHGSGMTWDFNTQFEEQSLPLSQQLFLINIILVVFNMLPVFPMDGGRVFRAILAFFIPWIQATRIAARIGQFAAIAGGLLALSAGQPFLLLIAVFIFFAAGSEASAAQTEGLLDGLTARQAAETEFHTVTADQPLSTAVEHLLHSPQHNYPVVDGEGSCIGVLTHRKLIEVLSKQGPETTIAEAMYRDFPTLDPDMPAIEAFRLLQQSRLPAAPLRSLDGEPFRWFTLHNLTDLVMTRSALQEFSASSTAVLR